MKKFALAALWFVAGCDPLLGGTCADGWARTAGACDAGAADVGGDILDASVDAGPAVDATTMDGGFDGAVADVGGLDGTGGDGSGGDGSACVRPRAICGGTCVDLASDRNNCGGCGRGCRSGELCVFGVCSSLCGAPLMICNGLCIDVQTDPRNCGGCGIVCPTGICNGGRCRDARAGHLVLIGHDYATTRTDQDRILGNAVFLSASVAPRVAQYTAWADATSTANVNAAIRTVAGLRAFTVTPVTAPEDLAAQFSIDRTDVVLVEHQPDATNEQISALAIRIAEPAVGFIRAGGVVVVLDGEGANLGTWPLAVASGLVLVSAHRVVTGGEADVVAGADAVAVGLSVAYRAERGSVAFEGTDGVGVVLRAGGLPLVVHRVVFGS